MIENYKVIFGDYDNIYSDEIVEKKSRFIAYIRKVECEEDAVSFINQLKKKHYDASHNCSAFVIGKKKELVRSSDDGEPQGTAGKPMLDVLMGSDIVNIVCVVTRYFGGTKLGPGGIARAYTDATKEGLKQCKIAKMCLGARIKINTDYNTIGKILNELSKRNLSQEDSEYTDVISLTITVPMEEFEDLTAVITEISAGQSKVSLIEETYFPILEENT